MTNMANEIEALLAESQLGGRKVRPKDIAILVRTNAQARLIWRCLRLRDLPAIVFSDVSLFEGEEARELLWVIEAIIDCRNVRLIKRAIATGLLGCTAKDFERWEPNDNEMEDQDSKEWIRWMKLFRSCLKTWRKEGVLVTLRKLFRETGAIQINLRRPDGERRVTNFLHLAEVLHQANSKNPLSPPSIAHWLRGKMADSDRSAEEYQLRLESESEAIQILTTHKSKGLEYPIVFLPFLFFPVGGAGGEFRYYDQNGELVIELSDFASEEALNKGRLEEEQEDARVLYVALTRAASRCYLYHCPRRESSKRAAPAVSRIIRSWRKEIGAEEGDSICLGEFADAWAARQSPGTAAYVPFDPNEPEIPLGKRKFGKDFQHGDFKRSVWDSGSDVPGGYLLTSFSSLVDGVDFGGRDLDAEPGVEGALEPVQSSEYDLPLIFKFRAGAHAGNFMHALFENIDFTDDSQWDGIVAECLKNHGYSVEDWQAPIRGMLDEVLQTELEPGLRLADIGLSDRRNELQFDYRVNASRLFDCCPSLPVDDLLRRYLAGVGDTDKLCFGTERYLTGLIDLLFRANNKYYLLDWKSNKLDGTPEGFGYPELEREMLRKHYVLQYHLYVVATHRFLRQRLPDYDYEKHFGGVYYLFVRGMKRGEISGIFRTRPDHAVVETLDRFLEDAS